MENSTTDKVNQNQDVEFWQYALESQKASGLSVRKFCKQEGLSEPAFYCWRKKLFPDIKSKQESSDNRFIEAGTLNLCDNEILKISFPSGMCIQAFNNCTSDLLKQALSELADKC